MTGVDQKKIGYLAQHGAGLVRPGGDCIFKVGYEIVRQQGLTRIVTGSRLPYGRTLNSTVT
jgi:hypothetical protein